MDVSGPFVVESLVHHNQYIIIFVDSSSRMIFDYYTKEVDAESILSVMKSFNSEILSYLTLDGDIIFIQSDYGQMKSDKVIAYIRRNNI
jgi:reverse gyrase